MAGAAQKTSRTRAAGVGLSLVLHVAALSWLGLQVVRPAGPPPPPEAAPLTVELVRPPRDARAPPPPAAPRAAAPATTREAVVAARPRPATPVPPLLSPRPLPLPPVPSGAGAGAGRGAGSAAGSPGARPAPGPMPGTEMQSDLRGFLRGTVGCSHVDYLRLTPAERARCEAGFATAAKTAPSIPLSDEKLAGFARQADADARRRARREGSLENTLPPCDPAMVGSNLGISCLPPQAHTTVLKF